MEVTHTLKSMNRKLFILINDKEKGQILIVITSIIGFRII